MLLGWSTDSEVVGSNEVEIERAAEASDPLLHVQGLQPADLRLNLGDRAIQLPVEPLKLRSRAIRRLLPFAVRAAKIDFPPVRISFATARRVG
jgi:hypothetical protein